jgi:hypothetical protein
MSCKYVKHAKGYLALALAGRCRLPGARGAEVMHSSTVHEEQQCIPQE